MSQEEYTIRYIYDFISEQVKKGLFKSGIVDKLIDLGVIKDTADELVALFYAKLKGDIKTSVMI